MKNCKECEHGYLEYRKKLLFVLELLSAQLSEMARSVEDLISKLRGKDEN